MSDGLDLKAFLERKSSEGEVDSEGAFTVAREKALKKLASFALPSEYDWVLKIVQAANLWQVPVLQVRQSRVATSFFCCPSEEQEFPSEALIIAALEEAALDQDNPVHQLAMALRSIVEQSRLSFVLAVRHGGELGEPVFAGDDANTLDSESRRLWAQISQDGLRLTVSHFQGEESFFGRYLPRFSDVTKRHLKIAGKLEDRCFVSQVPIILDGRLLSKIFPRGDFHNQRLRRPVFQGRLSEGDKGKFLLQSLEGLPGVLPVSKVSIKAQELPKIGVWFFASGRDSHTFASSGPLLPNPEDLILPDVTERYHRVFWVRQGVTVAGFYLLANLRTDLELTMFFSGSHLRTDLSGLQVEFAEDAHKIIARAFASVKSGLQQRFTDPEFREVMVQTTVPPLASPLEESLPGAIDQVGETLLSRSLLAEIPNLYVRMLKHRDQVSQERFLSGDKAKALQLWFEHLARSVNPFLLDLDRAEESVQGRLP